jgi:hypothetical protein
MTKENRKKLFLSDPKRFAVYGDEFKDEIAKKAKAAKAKGNSK